MKILIFIAVAYWNKTFKSKDYCENYTKANIKKFLNLQKIGLELENLGDYVGATECFEKSYDFFSKAIAQIDISNLTISMTIDNKTKSK